ncbi:futalosine hydrolase [Mucilaginibacter sp.]
MKVLVVAATEFEVSELIALAGDGALERGTGSWERGTGARSGEKDSVIKLNDNLSVLITGVGMVATAFALGKHMATHTYDLLLNLGIAGSFERSIALGEVVEVTTDTLSELGAEDGENFISVNELGFGEGRFNATAALANYYTGEPLQQVSAITVNTVHGNEQSIAQISTRLNVQLESMEGAAFFYACQQYRVPGLQIRAVSNYVEKRNRDAWQIGLAVKNLNTFALKFLLEREGRIGSGEVN